MKQDSEVSSMADGEPIYSEDGVDLTLIRWMLSLTPMQRLKVLQKNISFILKLRKDNGYNTEF